MRIFSILILLVVSLYTFNLKAYAQTNNPRIVSENGPHKRTIWWDPNRQK